jgi:hypothetical protein
VWNLMSLDFSRSEIKDAMSSSSVFVLVESPAFSSTGWSGFSLESLLPRPELVLLSAALLPCEEKRLVRPAKLLLYRTGAGFGDEEPEDAIANSFGRGGVRSCCCGSAFSDVRLLLLAAAAPPYLDKALSFLPAEVDGDGDGRGEEASDPALNAGCST